jgi:hypothetical protein
VRVLIVDDEAGARAALRRGLTVASSNTFDVIVLDNTLSADVVTGSAPSGCRLTQQLRAQGVDTLIVLISAQDLLPRPPARPAAHVPRRGSGTCPGEHRAAEPAGQDS